ncbi:MAG: fasciclin domain-containing protein [Armatimonadetes bacterium]|nr:fasciclin domain-containing protein [Armatimonadota bacterium]
MSGSMSSTSTPSAGMSSSAAPATPAATGDIVDVATATPQLSTLVKALQAAGLTDTLKGAGPFTVFAPSNRAFARLPQAQRDALMADPAALKNVLTYHVISGQKVDAAAAMAMTSPTSPPTVQGETLNVTTRNGRVMVNDATVVRPDIQASNGIIHIINRVLMPPARGTVPAPEPTL